MFVKMSIELSLSFEDIKENMILQLQLKHPVTRKLIVSQPVFIRIPSYFVKFYHFEKYGLCLLEDSI